jgi:hypothetical protein
MLVVVRDAIVGARTKNGDVFQVDVLVQFVCFRIRNSSSDFV